MQNDQYHCDWCEETKAEDAMYETGWNHDPICHECHEDELHREDQTGKRYVWVGDKRYLTS